MQTLGATAAGTLPHRVTLPQQAVLDPELAHDAAVRIVVAVKDQRPQRRL